jgi:hypothetical protein
MWSVQQKSFVIKRVSLSQTFEDRLRSLDSNLRPIVCCSLQHRKASALWNRRPASRFHSFNFTVQSLRRRLRTAPSRDAQFYSLNPVAFYTPLFHHHATLIRILSLERLSPNLEPYWLVRRAGGGRQEISYRNPQHEQAGHRSAGWDYWLGCLTEFLRNRQSLSYSRISQHFMGPEVSLHYVMGLNNSSVTACCVLWLYWSRLIQWWPSHATGTCCRDMTSLMNEVKCRLHCPVSARNAEYSSITESAAVNIITIRFNIKQEITRKTNLLSFHYLLNIWLLYCVLLLLCTMRINNGMTQPVSRQQIGKHLPRQRISTQQ